MKAALVVNLVTTDSAQNLAMIVETARRAALAGSDLVLFGEMAVTGMINDDSPANDLPLGETIPGQTSAPDPYQRSWQP